MIKRVLASAFILGTALSISAHAEIYPKTARIVNIRLEGTKDVVTLEDSNGFTWEYDGVEDYYLGDLVSLIMDDNGTEIISDDKIISHRYSGYYHDYSWKQTEENDGKLIVSTFEYYY